MGFFLYAIIGFYFSYGFKSKLIPWHYKKIECQIQYNIQYSSGKWDIKVKCMVNYTLED